MARLLALGSVLSLALVAGLGCGGATSAHAPPPRTAEPAGTTSEGPTPSAAAADGTSEPKPQASPQQAATTSTTSTRPTTAPPDTAPNAPTPDGFKPHDEPDQPPSAIGGGPKNEGGSVYGDGSEGNTGASPGGETPPPKK